MASARFNVTEWRESGDPVNDDFPVYLTTGRVVSQYLSGTQTRRIGGAGGSFIPNRARNSSAACGAYGINDRDWVTVTTRRAEITLPAMVTNTIRPDTVFIPYHWPGDKSANLLTHRTLDPRSKIPEFKVSACRIEEVELRRYLHECSDTNFTSILRAASAASRAWKPARSARHIADFR